MADKKDDTKTPAKAPSVLDVVRTARENAAKGAADEAGAAEAAAAKVVSDTAAAAAAAKVLADAQAAAAPPEGEKGKALTLKATAIKDGADPTIFYGIAASVNRDLDGDSLVQKSMVSFAHEFCSSDKRTFKANHATEVEMQLVESWTGIPIITDNGTERVLKAGETVTDPTKVAGISFKGAPTHWFAGVRPKDPAVLEAAKAGEIAGFSWGAPVLKKDGA